MTADDVNVFRNDFCVCSERCWRSVCRTCGGYVAMHVKDREHVTRGYLLDAHVCRGMPVDQGTYRWR